MGAKKGGTARKKSAKKASSGSKLKSAIGGKLGLGRISGHAPRRRHHGVTWWSNRVLIEKLKKRYFKLKYGGR